MKNCLRNCRSENYKQIVKNMLNNFQTLCCEMHIRVHFLYSHLEIGKWSIKTDKSFPTYARKSLKSNFFLIYGINQIGTYLHLYTYYIVWYRKSDRIFEFSSPKLTNIIHSAFFLSFFIIKLQLTQADSYIFFHFNNAIIWNISLLREE